MRKFWGFICILGLLFKLILVFLERVITSRIIKHFKDKELLEIGTQLSFYYFLIFLIFFGWRIPELYGENTGINGVGDFLAGLFSPIAFGWLIIGYLMQNKELKNSVEQTAEAQRLASDQLEFQKNIRNKDEKIKIIESQPIFDIGRDVLDHDGWLESEDSIIRLRVEKNDAFNVFFTRQDGHVKTLTHNESHIKPGQDAVPFFLYGVKHEEVLSSIEDCGESSFYEKKFLDLYINYTDKMGEKRKIKASLNARCELGERKVYIEYNHFEWE